MMKGLKRVLALCLIAVLAAGSVPVDSYAAEPDSIETGIDTETVSSEVTVGSEEESPSETVSSEEEIMSEEKILSEEESSEDLTEVEPTEEETAVDGAEVTETVSEAAEDIADKPVVLTGEGEIPFDGSGTESDPYIIKNIEDWKSFASLVNYGNTFARKYLKLDDDFTSPEYSGNINSDYVVGEGGNAFSGCLDGNGKTINIHFINNMVLFVNISNGAVIKNLTVKGKTQPRTATDRLAGLVGYSKGGTAEKPNTIDNCVIDVTLGEQGYASKDYCGGVVGNATDSHLLIKNVLFTGEINYPHIAGGGIVGWCEDGCDLRLENCLFAGKYHSASNCIFHPIAVRSSEAEITVAAKEIYYTVDPERMTDANTVVRGLKVTEDASETGEFYKKFTAIDNKNYYAVGELEWENLDHIYEYTGEDIEISPTLSFAGITLTEGTDYSVVINPQKVCDKDEYTITVSGNNDMGYYGSESRIFYVDSINDVGNITGNGSRNEPYIIKNVADWNLLAEKVSEGDTYSGKYIRLADSFWNKSNYIETSVGTESHPFCGIFDGNGRTVYVDFKASSGAYSLFEYVGTGAEIKNVRLEGRAQAVSDNGVLADNVSGGSSERPIIIDRVTVDVEISDGASGGCSGGVIVGELKTDAHIKVTDTVAAGSIRTGYGSGLICNIEGKSYIDVDNYLCKTDTTGVHKFYSIAQRTYWYFTPITDFKRCYRTMDCETDPTNTVGIGTLVYDSLPEGAFCKKQIMLDDKTYYIACDMKIDGIHDNAYTGSVIMVSPEVSCDGVVLTDEVDYTYTVSPEPVRSAGDYIVTISGINNAGYYGSITKGFTVKECEFSGGGSGSEEDPYIIKDNDDWETFSQYVASGISFSGSYLKLSNDFDNGEDPVRMTIGNDNCAFEGTFDGNNKTLNVNFVTEGYNTDEYNYTSVEGVAPFRRIANGAAIKNLSVCGNIKGADYSAGLVGYSVGGSEERPNLIENCAVSVQIHKGTGGNLGGIVGHGTDSYLKIKDSFCDGKMFYSLNAGGLMGWSDPGCHITMEKCIFDGEYIKQDSVINYSFHPIALSQSPVDIFADIRDCYYTVDPECYYLSIMVDAGAKAYKELPDGVFCKKQTFNGKQYYLAGECLVEGIQSYFCTGQEITVDPVVKYEETVLNKGEDYTLSISPETIKELGQYTVTVTGTGTYCGSKSIVISVINNTQKLDGEGTEQNPFIIKNINDWNRFSELVRQGVTFEDQYIELADGYPGPSQLNVIIGDESHPFKGIFDGKGKYVYISYADQSKTGAGLFNVICGATIKNLTVAGRVECGELAGGIVGTSTGRGNLISNCVVAARVESRPSYAHGQETFHVGGIVGNATTSDITIENCIVEGNLHITSGKPLIGAFIGWGESRGIKKLDNCLYVYKGGYSTVPDIDLVNLNNAKAIVTNCYKTVDKGSYGTFVYINSEDIPAGTICFGKKYTDERILYIPCEITGIKEGYEYTGSEIEVKPVITYEDEVLTEGVDYDVSFTPETVSECGKYTLTVTGKGSGVGQYETSFEVRNSTEGFNGVLSSDTIWFGGRQWRMLSDETDAALSVSGKGKALLISGDKIADNKTFTDAADLCEGLYYDMDSPADKAVVCETTATDETYPDTEPVYAAASLDKERFFLLSAKEAATYFPNDEARKLSSDWWLRSPGTEGGIGIVSNGSLSIAGADEIATKTAAVRPAFNLDTSRVLFVKGIDHDGTNNEGIFKPFEVNESGSWKLTLLDDDGHGAFNVSESEIEAVEKGVLKINYTGAAKGSYEYITMLIYDENGRVAKCASCSVTSADGVATFTLPDDLAAGSYKIGVYNERKNVGTRTDYASQIKEITLTVAEYIPDDPVDPIDPSDEVSQIEDLLGIEFERKETTESDKSSKVSYIIDKKGVYTIHTNLDGRQTIETKMWMGGLKEEYRYTGTAIKPAFHLFDGLKELVSGKDYTVKITNNKKAGSTATVKITFKGNYKGTSAIRETFKVVPAVIGEDVTVGDTIIAGTGRSQKPVPVLTWAATGKSVAKSNFSFSYAPEVVGENGTYTVTVTPKSTNFTGSDTAEIRIADKKIMLSKAAVRLTRTRYTWTGSAIEPEAGTYKLKLNNVELVEDVDYTMSVKNNIDVGTATIVFAAKEGNEKGYIGTKTATYKIVRGRLLDDAYCTYDIAESVPFAKGGAKPAVTVKDGETELVPGTDYTVSYSKNTSQTNGEKKATATVKGKGKYKGSKKLYFAVSKQAITVLKDNISVPDKVKTSKGYKNPSVTITDLDGKKLKSGKDFTLGTDYTEPDKNGIVYVSVIGKGNYDNEFILPYRVIESKMQLSKTSANKPADRIYTGYEITVRNSDMRNIIYTGKKKAPLYLKPGRDFEVVSVSNNIKYGTAKVVLRGKGAYGGTKTVKFKIKPKFGEYIGRLIGD